jgi:hypothetical protein
MTLPDFLMIGAPKAGTTALPVSPRTGGRIAKVTWTRNSPAWMFDEAKLHRVTVALDNPDCVDVELHSCRHRLGFAPDHPPYEEIEQRLAAVPAIAIPAVTPGGMANGNFPRLTSNQYSRHLIQGDLRDVSGRQPAATARRACQ